ncbi:MAG: exonuclease SbcCD subunit D [Pseudomonadales bacterium]
MRFIHTSDWQLGMTRALLHPEADARFGQARIDAIKTIGQLALEHRAQFIVVAGDVFESNQLSQQTLMRALDALEQVSVPIFLLPGNHDPLDGTAIFDSPAFAQCGDHIVVIRDQRPQPVPGLDNVEVVGAPWFSKAPSEDLCGAMAAATEPAEAGTLRIALAHGQVDAMSPDANQAALIDLQRAERALAEGRFHYLALGDRHSVTEVGGSGRIWFSGAPVATAFDEQQPNQALLVSLDEHQCQVEPLDTGAWQFIAEHRDMNSSDDVAALQAWLAALPNKERTALKIGFTGTVNLATDAQLATLLEEQAPLFASLKRRARTSKLAIIPDALDEDTVSLSGYARSTWNDLQEQALAGDSEAKEALRLLYRLSGQSV